MLDDRKVSCMLAFNASFGDVKWTVFCRVDADCFQALYRADTVMSSAWGRPTGEAFG
jgi:hypothetical protein